MKKDYETPQVEKMDFDFEETVTASGSGFTDADSVAWKCNTWYVDTPHPYVCGPNPNAG